MPDTGPPGEPPRKLSLFSPMVWSSPVEFVANSYGDVADSISAPTDTTASVQILRVGIGPVIGVQECVIGEQIRLMIGTNNDRFGDIRWSISGEFVTSYQMQRARASIERNTPTGRIASFYWLQPGRYTVEISGSVNKRSFTEILEFNVVCPVSARMIAQLDIVRIGENISPEVNRRNELWLGLMGDSVGKPGIVVVGEARRTRPTVNGTIAFVQLVKTSLSRVDRQGNTRQQSAEPRFVLDDTRAATEEDPSGIFYVQSFTDDSGSTRRRCFWDLADQSLWDNAGRFKAGFTDAPASKLLDISKTIRRDEFEVYMMFRSGQPGAIFVTLCTLQWKWKGTAIRTNDGRWELVDALPRTQTFINSNTNRKIPTWEDFASRLIDTRNTDE